MLWVYIYDKNIPEFHIMHEMPIALNICRLDDGDGMVSTLVSSKARYHESCRLKFNNTKLKRAHKGKVGQRIQNLQTLE